MNPFFWLIILMGLFVIWFGLRDLFEPIGKKVYKVADETKNIIEEVEETEEKTV